MASNPYNNPVYQRNRKALLADKPTCVACGIREADTADHIIEKDRGGTDDIENLRPMCLSCNAARGAAYGNRKRAAAAKARPKRSTSTASQVFGEGPRPRVAPSKDVYPPEKSLAAVDFAGSSPIVTDGGFSEPRLRSKFDSVGNHAASVAKWAHDWLKIDLMPWQIAALEGQLAYGADGKLLHRQSLVSVARQSGKTVCLKALCGWWLTEGSRVFGGPQTVISTAHALDLAVSLFFDLAPILEEVWDAKAKWSYGRNELRMPDGSLWLVRAATSSAGHGRGPTLILADEVWAISPEVMDQGLIPSQRAQAQPLLSAWSTAGTEESTWMLRYREAALAAIEEDQHTPFHFAEWSLPPGVDAMNRPDLWPMANPALGITIPPSVLEAEAMSPNRAAFLRGSLNLWVATQDGWLPHGIWDESRAPDLPSELPPPVIVAVDSSQDESRYVGVTIHPIVQQYLVRVAFVVPSEIEMWEAIGKVLPARNCQLLLTPTLETHCPPALERRTKTVGYKELLKWTGLVRSMIAERRVIHDGNQQLAEHMNRAVASRTQAGWVLSSSKSPGPIELARCAVWALAAASKPQAQKRAAIAVVGGR